MGDPVDDLKRELVAAAERRQPQAAGRVPRGRRSPRVRLALACAAVALAAGASLVAVAPWDSSPGFLAQAQAALSAPKEVVLHQKWVVTTTSAEFGCAVTHRPSEAWIDQAPPHRYRVVMNDVPPPRSLRAGPRALACWDGDGTQLGGQLDSGTTLELVDGELRPAGARFVHPVDPVADLRSALRDGTAHDEGQTTRDGRTLRRIRVDAEGREPTYWYVDPETFQPVTMEGPAGFAIPGRPLLELDVVVRFLVYEELPRTAANIALADVRAQDSGASG